MAEPEIALVFSPEEWVEELHRYFADHGGARVRQIVMDPALALDEEFDTLVVSHRWPALTRPFVDTLHDRRRTLLGVFDPLEPAGAQHLTELGVDRVIAADASMSEFLAALVDLAPIGAVEPASASDADLAALFDEPWPVDGARRGRAVLVAVGGPSGSGATEIAVHLGAATSDRGMSVVVVDADEFVPSVGPRLGLPIEPNIRTAVDAVEYGMGSLPAALARYGRRFEVLAGIPNVAAWSQVRPGEVVDVVGELCKAFDVVIVNVSHGIEDLTVGSRGRFGVTRAILAEADDIVGVGAGNPVGIVRLLGWVADVRQLGGDAPVRLVVNRAPTEPFKRGEIDDEICRTYPPASLTFVPFDRRVEQAGWNCELVGRGAFARAIDTLADVVFGSGRARSRSLATFARRRGA